MPILQYKCPKCGRKFEELVKKYDDAVYCPDCKTACERDYCGEMLSATGTQKKHCGGNCKTCGGCH